MSPKRMIVAGRLVLLVWAAFWTWFCVASALGEKQGLIGAIMHVVPALVIVASTCIAWRNRRVGGVLLIAESLFVASGVWVRPNLALFTILGLPPLVAGVLLIVARYPRE